MTCYVKNGTALHSYLDVHAAAIPKKDKGVRPLDFRLLAIYSAVYRIEMGAWYDVVIPDFAARLHPEVFGTLAGKEATEIAWGAQNFLETTFAKGSKGSISTYDYYKYFDTFQHLFTSKLLLKLGIPQPMADLAYYV